MSKIIMNPFTPIPKSPKSHVRGWATMWSQRLDAEIANKDTDVSLYEEIYIDHGVNFSGTMNLFGGYNTEVHNRVMQLVEAEQKGATLYSLDLPINEVGYVKQIEKRIGAATTTKSEIDLYDIEESLYAAHTLTMGDLKLPKAIIGDSHCLAYSTKDQKIDRRNGLTLYHVLNKIGLVPFINKSFAKNSSEIDLCLGSIDIRHHVFRHEVDAGAFAHRYAREIIKAQDYLETAINPCTPVPIETIDRKIPNTGKYRGESYFGSMDQRIDFTQEFIDVLNDYIEFEVVSPPKKWYTMDPYVYEKEIMEHGGSVHISPVYYRSIKGW